MVETKKKCSGSVCPTKIVPNFLKYLYFIKGNDVYRTTRAGAGSKTKKKILGNAVARKSGYLYYLKKGRNGRLNIHRAKLKNRKSRGFTHTHSHSH